MASKQIVLILEMLIFFLKILKKNYEGK